MKIVASDEAAAFIRSNGGRLWAWLDPHTWVGGTVYIYLQTALEPPGASRTTRRLRAARRPHRFHIFTGDGFEVHLEYGKLGPPDELHLELKRFPETPRGCLLERVRLRGGGHPASGGVEGHAAASSPLQAVTRAASSAEGPPLSPRGSRTRR